MVSAGSSSSMTDSGGASSSALSCCMSTHSLELQRFPKHNHEVPMVDLGVDRDHFESELHQELLGDLRRDEPEPPRLLELGSVELRFPDELLPTARAQETCQMNDGDTARFQHPPNFSQVTEDVLDIQMHEDIEREDEIKEVLLELMKIE